MNIAVVKAFYVQIGSVVQNLVEMFPDDADFPTFQTFIGMLQKTKPSLVINAFYENVTLKYEDKILNKDEAFISEYQGVEYGNDVADIISKVKSYWSVIDESTKQSLWQYMYILNELAKRAYKQE